MVLHKTRLFNEYSATTPKGLEIDYKFQTALHGILDEYAEEHDLNDLEIVLQRVIQGELAVLRLTYGMKRKKQNA